MSFQAMALDKQRTLVDVHGLVLFDAADMLITSAGRIAAFNEPERLVEAIRLASDHMVNGTFADAYRSGEGELANLGLINLPEFISAVAQAEEEAEERKASQRAKLLATQARRREFDSKRAHLVLKMLDAGVSYRCAIAGCGAVVLTVDHKTALSRGGTDDLDNLQFLCRTHNSLKGDK